MRILTGKDRWEYERGLIQRVHAEASLISLTVERDRLLREVEYERDRANQAVDALLLSKGHPPVSPSRPEEDPALTFFEEDPETLKALHKKISTGEPVMEQAQDQR